MSRDDPVNGWGVRVLQTGRLSVPVEIRRANGWEPGEHLYAKQVENGIVLRTRRQQTEHLQALVREMMKGKEPFTVDDFLAEKRIWAAAEEAEY